MISSDDKGAIIQQIEDWVRRNVAFPDPMHGKCNKIVLRHLNVQRQAAGDITAIAVKLEEGAEDELDPLLNRIASAAQQDTDDAASGLQNYAIYAYYPNDKSFVPQKRFRVAPSDIEVERDLNPSEPPTEKGLVAQTMRHLEAVMRHATVASGYQMQVMQREHQRLSEDNARYANQQIDFMVLMQDTMNDATKRRLAERETEAGIAMKEEGMAKLAALLPVIINKIAGTKVMPEEDRGLMLMAGLIEQMSDEQQQQFYAMLTDTQRMTLAEIISQYEQKKSKLLRPNPSPVGNKNALPSADDIASFIPVVTKTIGDRMTAATDVSSDPVLKKIEEDAAAFQDRFRNTQPEKKEKK